MGEVSRRVAALQSSKTHATMDRRGRGLCARAAGIAEWTWRVRTSLRPAIRLRAICSSFVMAAATLRPMIKACRTSGRVQNRHACFARWRKRRARSCRSTISLRPSMQPWSRTSALETTAILSNSIRPLASISAALPLVPPFSADPLGRKSDRPAAPADMTSVAKITCRFSSACAKRRCFRVCHVYSSMLHQRERIQRDRFPSNRAHQSAWKMV